MTINYSMLKEREFEPIVQEYTHRDTMLYALGLNLGSDPLNAEQLRYVAGDPPAVLPTMGVTLGRLGPWMREQDVGIDYRRIVVGEVSLKNHRALPPSGVVHSFHRIVRITDKGLGRGALVTVLRELRNADRDLLAEFEQTTFCRADGGFAVDGRSDPPPEPTAWSFEGHLPDAEIDFHTTPQQALIYRLTGDLNPLHSDPDTAKKAGFDRPILHGLATLGIAGYVLTQFAGVGTGIGLSDISCRFSAPVIPGDVLRFRIWRVGQHIGFQALVLATGKIALDRGHMTLAI